MAEPKGQRPVRAESGPPTGVAFPISEHHASVWSLRPPLGARKGSRGRMPNKQSH